jgi:tol-pal system protein YbgF
VSSSRFISSGFATRRRGLLCACSILIGALAISGCAVPQDNQQPADEDLRNTVAADRQQINSLQDQVARLNDQIDEMQHNGDSGGDSSGDSAKIAELEREVQALKGGSTATNAPITGGPTNANAVANGTSSNGPPGDTASPSTNGTDNGAPNAPAGPGTIGGAGAPPPGNAITAPPPPSGSIGNAPPANATADNDSDDSDDKDDNSDNGSQIASNAPPAAAAPPAAPGPPIVNGSPSWRGVLDQEIAAAQSSSDPAAKAYRAGLINMKAGKYSNAIGVFQGLQRRYPKSPLSEPAEYFSANALFELGKYDESILQFNDLVMRFPRGRFASASLLSEAQAFMKMNDRIDARLTLQKLISDHPDAPEAATAQAMMNSLANG